MRGVVVLDTNLLVLLTVGATSKAYIAAHKNTKDHFDVDDFELLGEVLQQFSDILVVAHVVAETSSRLRQIGSPRRFEIQRTFERLVSQIYELPVASANAFARDDSVELGVTDAVLLHVCDLVIDGLKPTLLTNDRQLADRANALGQSVIDW